MGIKIHQKWDVLKKILHQHPRMLVAFSGGCDSAFLLAAARQTLGKENVLAITAVSASLPEKERQNTIRLAEFLDVPHRSVETQELNNPAYAANPSNRCYFCKTELFSHLAPLARAEQMTLADGFNVSDRSDYRPGFGAAEEWQVVHPLDEAGLTKKDIRILSRWLRLPTWNKPASPCLSSRLPYGTPVTVERLSQIEQAEEFLHAEGFEVARVRHFGELARIEVPLDRIDQLKETQRWLRIVTKLQSMGYQRVEIDSRGFQSGRLNENLPHLTHFTSTSGRART